MTSWNHRVIEFMDSDGTRFRCIHEVHYDDAGKPAAFTEDGATVMCSDSVGAFPGLRLTIERMRAALEKPVLKESDFIGDAEEA